MFKQLIYLQIRHKFNLTYYYHFFFFYIQVIISKIIIN